MKKTKVFNLLSLICDLIIIGLFIYSYLFLIEGKVAALHYFTVLSNALLALLAVASIPFHIYGMLKGKKLNRPIFSLKFMGTVAVVTTMLTTICFLLPKYNWDVGYLLGFNNPLKSAEFFMHLVIPVIGLLAFVIFDKRNSNKHLFLLPLLGSLPIFAYGVFYVLNNILKFITPIDWYGFFDGKLWIGIVILALVLIGSYLIGLLLLSINRIGNNEEQEEASSNEEKYVDSKELSSDQVEEEVQEEKQDEPQIEEETTSEEKEEEQVIEETSPEEEVKEETEPQKEKKEEKPKTKKSSTSSKEKKPASTTKTSEKKKDASKDGSTKVYHLTKRKEDGMWAITFVGGKKAIKLFKTKKEAEAALEILTKNQGATALIRNSKGAKAGKFASSIKSEEK